MIIVEPQTIAPDEVLSSTVPLEVAWTAGTHATGVQRREGDYIYEVVADPNTTDKPSAGEIATPPTWLKVGLANRYRAFNGKLSRGVEHNAAIDMTFKVSGHVNTLYLYGLKGSSILVEVIDDQNTVFTQDYTLTDNAGIDNIWSFIYEPFTYVSERLVLNLPIVYDATIRIKIEPTDDETKLGEVIVGRAQEFGHTTTGLGIGITDFSTKEPDEFGDFNVIERAYSDIVDMDVVLTSQGQVRLLLAMLRRLRATPTLYIGATNRTETYVYGYFRQFNIILQSHKMSELNIEIMGVT